MPFLANVGVPMLFVYAPILIFGFAPIAIIEALWLSYRQPALSYRMANKPVMIANLWSTLLGIPLTWFALFVIQLATGGGSVHGTGWQAVT